VEAVVEKEHSPSNPNILTFHIEKEDMDLRKDKPVYGLCLFS
jgi:hypothetical protein